MTPKSSFPGSVTRWGPRFPPFLALFAIGCSAAVEPGSSDAGAILGADELLERFDAWIPELLEEHEVPGLAVSIARGGRVAWSRGYGHADLERGLAVTPQTLFNAGSISKAVSAWGFMGWVESGALDLDEPVIQRLDSWEPPESEFPIEGVTLRRLLSHTAGLNMHSIPGFELGTELPTASDIVAGRYRNSVYTDAGTPLTLDAAPGSRWSYSGGGFVLAQWLAETRFEQPFTVLMERDVLDPLGMHSSRFGWHPSIADQCAVPYDDGGDPHRTYVFSGVAGAGLYTSVEDLGLFAAAVLRTPDSEPGRGLLEPTTIDEMLRPTPLSEGTPSRCGLGYFLGPHGSEPRQAIHGGSNFGWQSVIVALPDHGISIAILSNSNHAHRILPQIVCTWGEIEWGGVLPGCP